MSQPTSDRPLAPCVTRRAFLGFVLCFGALALSFQGCTAERDSEQVILSEADFEAVEIWAHPDTVGIDVYSPLDFKAASRSVAWAIDGIARGVMRYEPSEGEHGVFGFQDHPPVEVVSPARLAVAENTGIFVFDDSTRMVDLYSPGGQHLNGFDPGLVPSILEVSRHPLRLTYGVRRFAGDSIPTLAIVQTDFLGQNPVTLLSSDVGPETLRDAPAVRGGLVSTASMSGLWIFSKTASDTVFEVSGSGPSRKLALPETDILRAGILADLQQEILWVVSPRPTGGLDYEAYDISGPGENGIIYGAQAYLGARTTPPSFLVRSAVDGSVSGWWRGIRGVHAPRGFDMRVEELREAAIFARDTRQQRRSDITVQRAEELRAAQEAEEKAQREAEQIREEDVLE